MRNILDYIEKIKQENEGPRITDQEPRNMYSQGQLVTPSVDGSRPGYSGLPRFVTKDPRSKSKPYRVKVKASKKLGRDKFEGKFSTLKEAKTKAAEFSGGKPGLAADPSIPKQTQKIVDRYNSLIEKGLEKKNLSNIDFFETWLKKNYPDNYGTLKRRVYNPDYNIKYTDITKAKEQLAKTLVDDSLKIERMVKHQDIYDKLGFSRSAKASPTIRNIVDKGLKNQLPKKVNLAFNNIVKTDALINGTLTNTIAERIGMVPTGATRWREYLTNNPYYKKNKEIMKYTFSSSAQIPGTTFSEMFDEGKYRIGGGVKWSGKETQAAGVRKNIMDYALTHWHRNNYDKGTSLIEFFDSKGDPIKWKPGLKLSISDVQFKIPSESDKMWSYRGKPEGSFPVSGQDARASGIFDEVTATYKTQQDLAGSWVTHPVSGKKVKFAELMDEVYRTGYGWTGKSTITGVDIDHFKGVKNHPFKNLRVMDKRMNITLGAIDKWIPNRNLKVRLKKELLGKLSTTTGSNYEKALKKNFLKQADDVLVKGIVPEKKLWASTLEAVAKQKDLPQTQIKILGNFWCGTRKASGGRIGFASGSGCPDSVKRRNFLMLTNDVRTGRVTGEAAEQIAKNAGKVVAKVGSKSALASILGPAAIGIDIAYEVGSVGWDVAKGKPWKEAVQDNWIMGAFVPGTGSEEFHKRLAKINSGAAVYGQAQDLITAYDKKANQIERLKADTTYRGQALAKEQIPLLEKQMKEIENNYVTLTRDSKAMEEGSPEHESYMSAVTELRDSDKAKSKIGRGIQRMDVRPDRYKPRGAMEIDYSLPKPVEISETPLDANQLQAYAEYHRDVGDLEPRGELPQSYIDEIQQQEKWRQLFEQPGIRGTQDWRGAGGGRAGYMGGGITGIRKPHAIPPERQGLRSIMINGKKS